ncbi:MAG: hypothetical protein IPM69_06115 [Ignavibacteria bacterium]|nr:hypothetical protein [Ignavibacteria bacterium]
MKRLVLLFAIAIFSLSNVEAQNTFPMGIGPFVAVKACINTASIMNGTKTGMTINGMPDLGATFYLPFSAQSTVGATLDLGYSTYSIKSKPESGANDDNTFVSSGNYFSIAPNINFSGFMLGMNVGIPVGTSVSNLSGTLEATSSTTDGMATIIDFRLGGMIPLMHDATGRLNFIVMGGYMVTGMDSDDTSEFNPKAASLMIGFNYLFSIK